MYGMQCVLATVLLQTVLKLNWGNKQTGPDQTSHISPWNLLPLLLFELASLFVTKCGAFCRACIGRVQCIVLL